MMARNICEAYTGISPLDVEEMTLDQIYLLSVKKDYLRSRQLTTVKDDVGVGGVKRALHAAGITEDLGGYGSLAQKIAAEAERAEANRARLERRRRRREKRRAVKEAKRQQEEQ